MKKNTIFILLLLLVTFGGAAFSKSFTVGSGDLSGVLEGVEMTRVEFDHLTDTPLNEGGNGFAAADECGFVYGVSETYNDFTMNFTNVEGTGVPMGTDGADDWQPCFDENGYLIDPVRYANSVNVAYYSRSSEFSNQLFELGSALALDIDHRISFIGVEDISDPSSSASYETVVDQSTGMWSGYARIFGDDFDGNRWVDFDWRCSESSLCYGENTDKYHVSTNLDTGEVSGYAWNDTLGFISFNGLTQELRPRDIVVNVDVLASGSYLGLDDVDYTTAPLADGEDYWRIRVQLFDTSTNEFLGQDAVQNLTLEATATEDSVVYLNQIEDKGDAIRDSYQNDAVGCTTDAVYCLMTEADGSVSFNRFIYSGAPTSNVLGEDTTADGLIDYYSDREACRWIYTDQWKEVDGSISQPPCGFLAPVYLKSAYFYGRESHRNKYELESITLGLSLVGGRDFVLDADAPLVQVDDGTWSYAFSSGAGELSYRPRYQITQFTAYYNDEEYAQISEDLDETMSLKTRAAISETSSAYQRVGGLRRPSYSVYYQMDVDSNIPLERDVNNNFLLIDADASPPSAPDSKDVEETHRVDTIASGFAGYLSYERDYAIGYGQKASLCAGSIVCAAANNILTEPTAEQWVCDSVTVQRFGSASCYYTDYLPHVDRYKAPEPMLVIGGINAAINDSDILTNEAEISILGSTETIVSRNNIYAQVVRYTLGQEASSGFLNSTMEPSSGLLSLMNGRLIYAEGNVTVRGSSDFSDKTLVVVGGDIYIDGDVEGGQLGLIALTSEGVGGNVYVAPSVRELHANLFLDGGFFSYDGEGAVTGEPTWNEAVRLVLLRDQLYLKGSLVSRNTVHGSSNVDEDGTYELGDGTATTDFSVAREHDLNALRQFRLCFPLNLLTGIPDTSAEAELCGDGERLSEYGQANELYNSFILDYSPPTSLPIFMTEGGFF